MTCKNESPWQGTTYKQKLLSKSGCLSPLTRGIIGNVNMLDTENEYHSCNLPKLIQRVPDGLTFFPDMNIKAERILVSSPYEVSFPAKTQIEPTGDRSVGKPTFVCPQMRLLQSGIVKLLFRNQPGHSAL